jgi:hypothetical protein
MVNNNMIRANSDNNINIGRHVNLNIIVGEDEQRRISLGGSETQLTQMSS